MPRALRLFQLWNATMASKGADAGAAVRYVLDMPDDPLQREPGPWILEWYRLDHSRHIKRALVTAAALTLVGSLTVAHALAIRSFGTAQVIVGLTGLAFTVAGPLVAIFGLRKVLLDDDYVALRSDGVCLAAGHPPRVLGWNDLREVRYEPEAEAVAFELSEGEVVHLRRCFAGIELPGLAKRIEHVRHKALWNLLHTLDA